MFARGHVGLHQVVKSEKTQMPVFKSLSYIFLKNCVLFIAGARLLVCGNSRPSEHLAIKQQGRCCALA
jgi:hypothetical protein